MSEAIKNETTEMAVASGYSAIANMDFLAEAMNDDCAGLDFKFDRIKIPSGGMTAFEVPSEDGEGSDLVKEIEAVILYSHPANSYYTEAYKGGSNPPDCGSFDGITGTGTPGGICKNCPFNQFGSGEGKSKACKNRRMLYLLRENEIFPLTLNLPTGSLDSPSMCRPSLPVASVRIRSLPRSVSARLPVHPALISVRRCSR